MKRVFFVLLVALAGLTTPTLHAQVVTDLVLFAPPTPGDIDQTSSTVISIDETDSWVRKSPPGKMIWVSIAGTTSFLAPSETVNGSFLKANGPGTYQLFYTIGTIVYLEEVIVN